MNLTVDASIAVKWFVAESLCDDARRLLSHRLCLHAPDILIAEFANTIWNKTRKGEIEGPQPYFDELAHLPDILTLHPSGRLLDRAARIAVAIDHPVYDCLYLACAEGAASALITADRNLPTRPPGNCRARMSAISARLASRKLSQQQPPPWSSVERGSRR